MTQNKLITYTRYLTTYEKTILSYTEKIAMKKLHIQTKSSRVKDIERTIGENAELLKIFPKLQFKDIEIALKRTYSAFR